MTVSSYQLGAHAGTHVDAPNHFIKGAPGIDSVPLDALVGPAYVVDLTHVESVVTEEVLEDAGVPGATERLLLKTSNSGWSRRDSVFDYDYVSCDASAARWCLERGVRLVGIDYLSVERFHAEEDDFPVHKSLLGEGVAVVEALDLESVPEGRYELIVLPLLVVGSDAAPARALLIG